MSKKILFGLLFGAIAGILDVIPMVIQKLPWNADVSAFSMWVVIGFLISVSSISINRVLKGILISLCVLLPNLFIIAENGISGLIPIVIITLILGGLLGLVLKQ